MGIRGLYTFMKTRLSQTRKSIHLGSHSHSHSNAHPIPCQTWAIDASSLLFRARSENLSPTTVFASLIVSMRRNGVTPIVVFDGQPPASKAAVLQKRRDVRVAAQTERAALSHLAATPVIQDRLTALCRIAPVVTRDDRSELKAFLVAAGVLYVTPRGEADDLLGFLARTGKVDAVLSNDTDMLARGVERLILPETVDATVLTEVRLSLLLTTLRLTYEEFVVACMYMGTDVPMPEGWFSRRPEAAIAAAIAMDESETDVAILEAIQIGAQRFMAKHITNVSELMNERHCVRWTAGAPPSEPDILLSIACSKKWPMDWIHTLSHSHTSQPTTHL